MSKRILIFSLTYLPFVGGAEIALKEITDRLSPDELDFDMITLRFDKNLPTRERLGNVTVYRVGFTEDKPSMRDLVRLPLALNKYLFPFLAWRKALRLNREHHYGGMWAMMANYAGFGALFFKFSHPGIPMLLTLQEGDPIEHIKHRVRFVYPLFKKIFQKADFIQTISYYLAGFARDMGYKGPLEVIPNAVDVTRFSQQYAGEELKALRHKFGLKDSDKILITTSRLVVKNGIEDVISALPNLPDNVHFLILGIGPDAQKLKSLAHSQNVADRVHFLGQIDQVQLPKYLKIADIFIRPSLSEGMGISFIEAMAAKIPVIATPVGGIVDFLFDPEANPDHEPTGLFAEVRNPESIARQVQKLLENAQVRSEIVENASTMVREKYDWNLISRDMRSKVFEKLI